MHVSHQVISIIIIIIGLSISSRVRAILLKLNKRMHLSVCALIDLVRSAVSSAQLTSWLLALPFVSLRRSELRQAGLGRAQAELG